MYRLAGELLTVEDVYREVTMLLGVNIDDTHNMPELNLQQLSVLMGYSLGKYGLIQAEVIQQRIYSTQ